MECTKADLILSEGKTTANCGFYEKSETFEAVLNAISDAIVLTDVDRKIIAINAGVEMIFGYTIDDLRGKTTSVLYETEEEYVRQGNIRFNLSAEEKKRPYEVRYRRKNGEIFPGETIGTVVKNNAGEIFEYIGVIRDITERKKAEQEIARLAMTDTLTGLSNRHDFNHQFSESLKLAKRENQLLALLIIDLNDFKPINDTFGHMAGDKVLQAIAQQIKLSCRETDIVARLGGDEFAIILRHPLGLASIMQVVDRIIQNTAKPITFEDHTFELSLSIGLALYPEHGHDEDTLLRRADIAMYKAKQSHTQHYCIFDATLTLK